MKWEELKFRTSFHVVIFGVKEQIVWMDNLVIFLMVVGWCREKWASWTWRNKRRTGMSNHFRNQLSYNNHIIVTSLKSGQNSAFVSYPCTLSDTSVHTKAISDSKMSSWCLFINNGYRAKNKCTKMRLNYLLTKKNLYLLHCPWCTVKLWYTFYNEVIHVYAEEC